MPKGQRALESQSVPEGKRVPARIPESQTVPDGQSPRILRVPWGQGVPEYQLIIPSGSQCSSESQNPIVSLGPRVKSVITEIFGVFVTEIPSITNWCQ